MAAVDRYLVLGAGHDLEQMVRRVPEDIVALLAQIGADSATAARRIALRQIADDERRAGLTMCPIIERRAHTRGAQPASVPVWAWSRSASSPDSYIRSEEHTSELQSLMRSSY